VFDQEQHPLKTWKLPVAEWTKPEPPHEYAQQSTQFTRLAEEATEKPCEETFRATHALKRISAFEAPVVTPVVGAPPPAFPPTNSRRMKAT
jgi:hypothetical protein